MITGAFSANGFRVAADSALGLVAGTNAAGAGMVSANIQNLATTMHADLGGLARTIVGQTDRIVGVNQQGFSQLGERLASGFSGLQAISGASLAVQAAGFAVVATRLNQLRGDVKAMHGELAAQGQVLIDLQRQANAHLESLISFAERTLHTQERILETLVSSRTVEAQQLIRQGWENLRNGYEDDAFSRFKRSLDHDNTVYLAHAELGRLLEKRGDRPAAEDHFRRATRFAGAASPQIKGFAHVQFAGFLDRAGRLNEAVGELDAAMSLPPPDVDTSAAWSLYKAELLASMGDIPTALESVAGSVRLSARAYYAALASERLIPAQPRLTQRLIDLDGELRNAALVNLEATAQDLGRMDRLDSRRAGEFRAAGAAHLQSVLTVRYDELAALVEVTRRYQAELREAVSAACGSVLNEVTAARQTLLGQLATIPKEPPVESGSSIPTAVFIGSIVLAFFTAGISLLGIPVAIVLEVRRRSASAQLKQERDAAIEAWRQFEMHAPGWIGTFESAKAAAIRFLRETPLEPSLSTSLLAQAEAIMTPPMPSTPHWVSKHQAEAKQAASDRRTNMYLLGGCGAVILVFVVIVQVAAAVRRSQEADALAQSNKEAEAARARRQQREQEAAEIKRIEMEEAERKRRYEEDRQREVQAQAAPGGPVSLEAGVFQSATPQWAAARDAALAWCNANNGQCDPDTVASLKQPRDGVLDVSASDTASLTTCSPANCPGVVTYVEFKRAGEGWSVSKVTQEPVGD